MNQRVIGLLYLAAGFCSLMLVSTLILQVMTLIFALYCLYKGMNIYNGQQPSIVIFMRNAYHSLFGRF